jgi:hypothetical protein
MRDLTAGKDPGCRFAHPGYVCVGAVRLTLTKPQIPIQLSNSSVGVRPHSRGTSVPE